MFELHSLDPNLLINAFRLILEGIRAFRAQTGGKEPEKQEVVLEKTVQKAEEMAAGGAGADALATEIESRLEYELGTGLKDEILSRAASILALTAPLDLESFKYYANLCRVLTVARDFCQRTNVFKLRGHRSTDAGRELLVLAKVAPIVQEISSDFGVLRNNLRNRQGVIEAKPVRVIAYLCSDARLLQVGVMLSIQRPVVTGGSYTEKKMVNLSLVEGLEVNRLGFEIVQPTEVPGLPGVDLRVTAKEFRGLVSALLEDVSSYAKELADEEREFEERIGPALEAILARWTAS